MTGPIQPAPGLVCPSPKCKGTQLRVIRYQGAEYLQCLSCKYWSTKYGPQDPGIFDPAVLAASTPTP